MTDFIHPSHSEIEKTEIDGKEWPRCTVCGGMTAMLPLPCEGPAPELKVQDDGDVIQIVWADGKPGSSEFPQPLVTVDFAIDERPLGVVFAGARARELREGLGNQDNLEARSIAGLALEFALDVLPGTGDLITRLPSYKRLKRAIKATRGENEMPPTANQPDERLVYDDKLLLECANLMRGVLEAWDESLKDGSFIKDETKLRAAIEALRGR